MGIARDLVIIMRMAICTHPALARALESDLARGPIPFSRFMELALYHPEGGYYCQNEPRVGRRGDFNTSPHQSPWFGRMIASQTEIIWEATGKPPEFLLIEYGPGEGWLARDLLEQVEAAGAPAFSEALEYIPIEISRSATKRLQDRLAPWMERRPRAPRVRFENPPSPSGKTQERPDGYVGVVLAQEFLDALPFHIVVQNEEGLRERYVQQRGERLVFQDGPLSDPRIASAFKDLKITLEVGQIAEISLAAEDWIASAAASLARGALLIFDYGFSAKVLYHPSRKEGTFRGYRKHSLTTEVLKNPGETDITSHINFTSIVWAAEEKGLELSGFTDQSHFLMGLGIAKALEEDGGEDTRRDRTAAFGLMNPAGLGGAIKVLLLTKGIMGKFPAFAAKPDDRESFSTLRG